MIRVPNTGRLRPGGKVRTEAQGRHSVYEVPAIGRSLLDKGLTGKYTPRFAWYAMAMDAKQEQGALCLKHTGAQFSDWSGFQGRDGILRTRPMRSR